MPEQSPAPTLALHHLAVKVKDLARAEAFYGGVLGLRVSQRHPDVDGAPRAIWLDLGAGAFLAIERAQPGEAPRADAQPGWHCVALAIGVEHRDAWRARLTAHGFPVERESPYTLYVRDPEGALVALSHHPVAATEATEAAPSGVTARLAALVTLSALLLALGPFTADAQRRRTAEPPADVILLGSSSVNGAFGRLIESELEHQGMQVRRIGHSSTGLARPDFFDWQGAISTELGALAGMRGVIVYMGGNDTQAVRLTEPESNDRGSASWIVWREEARWVERYTARVTAFVAALCSAGARRAIVILPANGERAGWSERIHRVQDAQAAGTRATRCGVVVDPRGVPVRVGSTVDGVHLSRSGSRTVWDRIGPSVATALGAPAPG